MSMLGKCANSRETRKYFPFELSHPRNKSAHIKYTGWLSDWVDLMWRGVRKKKIKSGKSIKINCHHHYYHRYILEKERELTKLHGDGVQEFMSLYMGNSGIFLRIVLRYQQNEILYCDSLASHGIQHWLFFSTVFYVIVSVVRFSKNSYQEQ